MAWIAAPSLKYSETRGRCLHSATGGSGDHTRPLALLLHVEAVPVAVAASVPELGAGVGLLVVVPADVIVPTRALVQDQDAPRVQGYGLFRERWPQGGLVRYGDT